jgi:hypothetical protein
MPTDPNFVPASSLTERDTDIPADLCSACGHDETMTSLSGEPLATRDEWPVKRKWDWPGTAGKPL